MPGGPVWPQSEPKAYKGCPVRAQSAQHRTVTFPTLPSPATAGTPDFQKMGCKYAAGQMPNSDALGKIPKSLSHQFFSSSQKCIFTKKKTHMLYLENGKREKKHWEDRIEANIKDKLAQGEVRPTNRWRWPHTELVSLSIRTPRGQ